MNLSYSILIFIGLLIGLSSCKNNDEVFAPVINTNLTVVNASADTLNFYLNGTRQNNTSSLFPDGSVVDITVPAGLQNYQFKKAGAFTVLFSIPLNLRGVAASLTDTIYNSLYVAGESSSLSFSTLDTLLVDTQQNMSTIRFVNASPDAGSVNVFVGDTVNFMARAFKSSSGFLAAGSGLKEVKVYLANNSTSPQIDTSLTFLPNQIYTLFTKGLINGKGNSKFDVGLVVNSQPTVTTNEEL